MLLWCGDFNRHHPLWDNNEDERLFTPQAMREAEVLIGMVADEDMVMVLPKGIPTLKHMVTNRYHAPILIGSVRRKLKSHHHENKRTSNSLTYFGRSPKSHSWSTNHLFNIITLIAHHTLNVSHYALHCFHYRHAPKHIPSIRSLASDPAKRSIYYSHWSLAHI
ncbi:hypothetical protein BYT27DRAFT_7092816 [Phlegmacium glaucopus]|nr:hypothetical protein BYT27DRAFT_7092816 [Phlegmacium glaucopus]